MKKWYQGIVVEHKELDNKMYHCFDDENFEKLTNERNEQLKEIERLNKELEYLEKLNNANYLSFIEVNNIINEFDKFLFGELQTYGGGGTAQEYYDKLQELKGSDK